MIICDKSFVHLDSNVEDMNYYI